MLPTLQATPPLPAPPPILKRIGEIVAERRLPYIAQRMADKLAVSLGLREKTIACNGMRFRVRRLTSDELFVANIAGNGDYSPAGYEIRPGDTVVDIGGNIGTFAISAARVAAKVIAVEPNADNFALLTENIRLNRANVTPINAAVCNHTGTVDLHCGGDGGMFSIVDGRGGSITETVTALRLADILATVERCDFLKMDCEGAEHEILHGLPAECFAKISRIAMEWHGEADRERRIEQGCSLVDRLQSHGFHIDSFTEFPAPFRCGMIFAHR